MPSYKKFTTKAGDKEYLEIKWGPEESWPSLDEIDDYLEDGYPYLYLTANLKDQSETNYTFSSVSVPRDSIEIAWFDLADKAQAIINRYSFITVQEAGFIVYQWGFTNE